MRVEEFAPLRVGEQVALEGGGTCSVWSEDARVLDAEVVLAYAEGPCTSRPAATRRTTGSGAAWYLGTLPDDRVLGRLLERITDEAGVTPVAAVPAGVEVTRRRSDAGSWLFVLNHTTDDCDVTAAGHDLVAGADVGPVVTVAARTAAVIRET